jgi:hypothetical protein
LKDKISTFKKAHNY